MSISSRFVVRVVGQFAGLALLFWGASATIERTVLAQVAGGTAPASSDAPPSDTADTADETPAPPARATQGSQGGSSLYRFSRAYQRQKAARARRRTVKAHVVALDQPYMWNRLGASQPNAMIYALARDVVPTDYDPKHPTAFEFATLEPGKVRLREDKRPRPPGLASQRGRRVGGDFHQLAESEAPGQHGVPDSLCGFPSDGTRASQGGRYR